MPATVAVAPRLQKSLFPDWVVLAAERLGLEPAYVKQLAFSEDVGVFRRAAVIARAMVETGFAHLADRHCDQIDEGRFPAVAGVLDTKLELVEEEAESEQDHAQIAFIGAPDPERRRLWPRRRRTILRHRTVLGEVVRAGDKTYGVGRP